MLHSFGTKGIKKAKFKPEEFLKNASSQITLRSFSTSASVYEEYISEKLFGENKQTSKIVEKPLFTKEMLKKMIDSIEKMRVVKKNLNVSAPSILDIHKKHPARFRFADFQENQNADSYSKAFSLQLKMREEFKERIRMMGLYGKSVKDNELRYEALIRAYLRYRRKRVYQRLAEFGITNRRPRRVTKEQYKRFLKFKKTRVYPTERPYGPMYVTSKNGVIVRKDIYEAATELRDKIKRFEFYEQEPLTTKLPDDFNNPEDLEKALQIEPSQIGEMLRCKEFQSWEEKFIWGWKIQKNIEKSIQYYEAFKHVLKLRLKIIERYENNTVYQEYLDLSKWDSEVKNIFMRPEGEFEKDAMKGFIYFVSDKIDALLKKKLLIKYELENQSLIKVEPFMEEIQHKVRIDREKDESKIGYLKENQIMDTAVLTAEILQRNQLRLVNPDLFLRFNPPDWRNVEKKIMFWVNRREMADSHSMAKFNEQLRAHKKLFSIFENPQNKKENQYRYFHMHRKSIKNVTNEHLVRQWATGIVNGIQPEICDWRNPHLVKLAKAIDDTRKIDFLGILILNEFPYDEVDMETSLVEAGFLHAERTNDRTMAHHVVNWFASPGLNSDFGHGFNPFRYYVPRQNLPESYTWKPLLDAKEKMKDDFSDEDKKVYTLTVKTHFVSHQTKMDRITSIKCAVVVGNGKGALGFYYGKTGENEGKDKCIKKAAAQMTSIPLYRGRALYHNLEGKWNNTKVKIIATPPGYGLVGPFILRTILLKAGIKDATIMQFGNNNPISLMKACFVALSKARDLNTISWARGKKIHDLSGEIDGQCYHLPYGYDPLKKEDILEKIRKFEKSSKNKMTKKKKIDISYIKKQKISDEMEEDENENPMDKLRNDEESDEELLTLEELQEEKDADPYMKEDADPDMKEDADPDMIEDADPDMIEDADQDMIEDVDPEMVEDANPEMEEDIDDDCMEKKSEDTISETEIKYKKEKDLLFEEQKSDGLTDKDEDNMELPLNKKLNRV